MYTCAQLATAISRRTQTLYGKETRHHSIYIAKQVHVWVSLQTKI